jgi:hypothetical protein
MRDQGYDTPDGSDRVGDAGVVCTSTARSTTFLCLLSLRVYKNLMPQPALVQQHNSIHPLILQQVPRSP